MDSSWLQSADICWPLDLRCAWSFACNALNSVQTAFHYRWSEAFMFTSWLCPLFFLFWFTIWVNFGHVILTYDFDRGSLVHIIQHSTCRSLKGMFPPLFVLVSIFFWTSRNLTVTTQNPSISYNGLKSKGLFELRSMPHQMELPPSSRQPYL